MKTRPFQGRAGGQNQSTQGCVWEGGVPLPYVRKKNQNMNEMVASPAFSEPKHRLKCFQNNSEKQSKSYCFGSGLLQNRYTCNVKT